MESAQLEKIKRRLGIDPADSKENDLLQDLVDDAESYFKSLTGTTAVDPKYNFMIENVVYKLYGRKGSEGVTSETVDGYSVTYQDWDNLFKPYMAILNKDFNLDGSLRERGRVVFLLKLHTESCSFEGRALQSTIRKRTVTIIKPNKSKWFHVL